MTENEIPDYNIFMMCDQLNGHALTQLPDNYYIRSCRPEELEIWKAFPFDKDTVPTEYEDFMNQYIAVTYSHDMDTFFQNTLFVCDQEDRPSATCSHWKAYGKLNTIQWLKVRRAYEGKGLGRAVLSVIMKRFSADDYPIFLHTQPGSFRAIKLYSDFGFKLLKGGQMGTRTNELEKCLPILKSFMPQKDFEKLKIIDAPVHFIKLLENETTIQF
ncbi:Acetyltransferase (GNAT) family protein [Parapedobacter composti]|uniref:Acetyltransferase (GNAT) family protein n=1 Tax=Parapedobacter composti TaxID=623281 RepID=A0A1I1FAY1_9SPHI|nr:GNAT family N-acetyltransferase [Parapedobacter composti]SFB96535.1 Acetyltransferase (GNAT) family protein [Parapedobacter composti]